MIGKVFSPWWEPQAIKTLFSVVGALVYEGFSVHLSRGMAHYRLALFASLLAELCGRAYVHFFPSVRFHISPLFFTPPMPISEMQSTVGENDQQKHTNRKTMSLLKERENE